jgi:hypothetical protein
MKSQLVESLYGTAANLERAARAARDQEDAAQASALAAHNDSVAWDCEANRCREAAEAANDRWQQALQAAEAPLKMAIARRAECLYAWEVREREAVAARCEADAARGEYHKAVAAANAAEVAK